MNKNNDKVPVAILSCFLIAFVIQGILKISGVFIFEKALSWEIFKVIDENTWLQVSYYSIINLINVYCLSFALTTKCYSKNIIDYLIIIITTFGITACRILIKTPFFMEYIYDAVLYIIVPVIISLKTKQKYKLQNNNFISIINIITIHIMLYFCYLGLGYWSGLTSSIITEKQIIIYASSIFLVQFERYIGMVLMMLSLNNFIKIIKNKEI